MRAARRIRSACCLQMCPWRHRSVFQTFCTLFALSPGMSLVTACMCCMSCVFCTAAEDDPEAWDASDVDMFTQFSEAEGEGEGGEGRGGGMGRGGQTPMRLVDGRCPSLFFFHTPPPHTHTAPAAASQETPQWWRH